MENNPYGMLALWNQGGWVIRFVAIVLFGMSVVSWTIIVVRAWNCLLYTSDQYDASRYQSAPQHTVEFADARIETRNIDRIDIRQ